MFTETFTPSPVPPVFAYLPGLAVSLHPVSRTGIIHVCLSAPTDGNAECAFVASEANVLEHNCSAICGSRREERCGTVCRMILGTSMTCSTSGNELSRIFNWAVYFSRTHLPALAVFWRCARLGKGHCDAHPCILEVSTEASLSAAAGTACAAALIAVNVQSFSVIFYHFLSCSFVFFRVLSFSIMFFHVL